MARTAAALVAVTVAVAGCGGEVPGAGYPGDPFVTVTGTVESTTPLPLEIDVIVQWQKGDAPALWPAVTGARRDAAPPPDPDATRASFVLPIFYPPMDDVPPTDPSGAVFKPLYPGETPIARGNVAAVPYGSSDAWIEVATRDRSPDYGADALRWIVFSYGTVPARSVTAWWTGTLGAGLPPGFHVLEVTPRNASCISPAELEACVTTLVSLGVPDDSTAGPGTARGFCTAPYQLRPAASVYSGFVVRLGTYGLPDPGPCP